MHRQATPLYSPMQDHEDGHASTIPSEIAAGKEDAPLGKSTGFKDFREGLGDHYPVSIYFNAQRYFEREEESPFGQIDALVKNRVSWSKSNAEGAGIGIR